MRQEENMCSLEPVGVLELALFVGSSEACVGGGFEDVGLMARMLPMCLMHLGREN